MLFNSAREKIHHRHVCLRRSGVVEAFRLSTLENYRPTGWQSVTEATEQPVELSDHSVFLIEKSRFHRFFVVRLCYAKPATSRRLHGSNNNNNHNKMTDLNEHFICVVLLFALAKPTAWSQQPVVILRN